MWIVFAAKYWREIIIVFLAFYWPYLWLYSITKLVS